MRMRWKEEGKGEVVAREMRKHSILTSATERADKTLIRSNSPLVFNGSNTSLSHRLQSLTSTRTVLVLKPIDLSKRSIRRGPSVGLRRSYHFEPRQTLDRHWTYAKYEISGAYHETRVCSLPYARHNVSRTMDQHSSLTCSGLLEASTGTTSISSSRAASRAST